jgi:hypothetical protein
MYPLVTPTIAAASTEVRSDSFLEGAGMKEQWNIYIIPRHSIHSYFMIVDKVRRG